MSDIESMRDSVKGLLRGLREERARTAVTLLGLGWGTFSIVVLISFGTGLQALLREKAAALGRGVTIVWPQRTTRPWAGMGEGRPVRLRPDDVLVLPRQITEIELVSPEYMVGNRVTVGERILFVLVEERRREIGIQMALGARPKAILRGVLLEGLAMAFAGGAIGALGSAALLALYNRIPLGPDARGYLGFPTVSIGVAIAVTIILGLAGSFAAYFPARRAAALEPVDALREK